MKYQLFPAFLALLLYQCTASKQPMYNDYEMKSGACYAKALIPETHYTDIKTYVVYTGDASKENVDVTPTKIVIQEGGVQWVKKKQPNCHGNPDDCLVWCKEDIPEIAKYVKILNDTMHSKNFELMTIEYPQVTGAHYKSIEVICHSEITPEFITKLQESLRGKGYNSREKNVEKLDKLIINEVLT